MARFGPELLDTDDAHGTLSVELSRLSRKFTLSLLSARQFRMWPDCAFAYGCMIENVAGLYGDPVMSDELYKFCRDLMLEILRQNGIEEGDYEAEEIVTLFDGLGKWAAPPEDSASWVSVDELVGGWLAKEQIRGEDS